MITNLFQISAAICLLTQTFAASPYMANIVFPQCGQRGTTVELEVEGAFLDSPREVLFYRPGVSLERFIPLKKTVDFRSGKDWKLKPGEGLKLFVKISPEAPLGEHRFRIRTATALSEMLTFWVTPLTCVPELHPWKDVVGARNDSPATAQTIPLESTVIGYLPEGPDQDDDFYKVAMKKGQRLSVESVAARLRTWQEGGKNDPALRIIGPDGELIAHAEDSELLNKDPWLSIIAEKDGDHLIHMHQQNGDGKKMRHYLLHIGSFERPTTIEPAPPSPTVSVQLPTPPSHPPTYRDHITVHRGGTLSRQLTVLNNIGNTYSGKLKLRALGLPPGVQLEAPEFTADSGEIQVTFRADPDAQLHAALVDFITQPVGESTLDHQTTTIAFAVVESSPFQIAIEQPIAPLVIDGDLSLKVKITRARGFEGEIYCDFDWLPDGIQKQPPILVPSDVSEIKYRLRATTEAAPGKHRISLSARTNHGGNLRTGAGIHYISTPPIDLEVSAYGSSKLSR